MCIHIHFDTILVNPISYPQFIHSPSPLVLCRALSLLWSSSFYTSSLLVIYFINITHITSSYTGDIKLYYSVKAHLYFPTLLSIGHVWVVSLGVYLSSYPALQQLNQITACKEKSALYTNKPSQFFYGFGFGAFTAHLLLQTNISNNLITNYWLSFAEHVGLLTPNLVKCLSLYIHSIVWMNLNWIKRCKKKSVLIVTSRSHTCKHIIIIIIIIV